MIGYIQGEVLFSDGSEIIVLTPMGIGYQIFYQKVLVEGSTASLYISHVIKEAAEDLYGFETLQDKKMFELLNSVKGVGPKSAFNLLGFLGTTQIISAVTLESKGLLTKAPGVGPKAAAQMILDLKKKIQKIKIYSNINLFNNNTVKLADQHLRSVETSENSQEEAHIKDIRVINDALLACKELGFKEDKIMPLAQKILESNEIHRAEQLVHLVLKEI